MSSPKLIMILKLLLPKLIKIGRISNRIQIACLFWNFVLCVLAGNRSTCILFVVCSHYSFYVLPPITSERLGSPSKIRIYLQSIFIVSIVGITDTIYISLNALLSQASLIIKIAEFILIFTFCEAGLCHGAIQEDGNS